jgi:hypothetical protein
MREEVSYKVFRQFFHHKSAFFTSLPNPSHDPAISSYTRVHIPTNDVTYSMQHSPSWVANRFSIPGILWKLKVHYRLYKSPPPAPILSQINPIHAPLLHYLKIHFNIILPSMPGSSKWSFPQVSPPKPCMHLSSSSYVPNDVKYLKKKLGVLRQKSTNVSE